VSDTEPKKTEVEVAAHATSDPAAPSDEEAAAELDAVESEAGADGGGARLPSG
jgi:hypothetical protein